jgi:uncharacterized damage-inducible protein DinB
MTIAEKLLPEFDGEMASTRRLLERIPADRLDWKPHAKSKSLGELATHLTELPRFGIRFEKDAFQIGSENPPAMRNAAEYLARFDENVAAGRAGIARMPDARMEMDFTAMRPNGEVLFTLKRRSLLRRVLLSHSIHHRGQLTVYLRLLDVPLPPVYGPTADESG